MIGIGWSLSGLSTITRGNKFDGGIKFDESGFLTGDDLDGYYFMGDELIPIDVGAPSFHAVYHTRRENFSKFEPVGLCGDGPCAWKVTDKSGIQFLYGDGDDAKLTGEMPFNAAGSVRLWALSKVTDINGNYFEVRYRKDDGEIYPAKIIYTQNMAGGISRFRVIEFDYDEASRRDSAPSYASGSLVRTKWRLQDITVKTNVMTLWGLSVPFTGDLVRRYHLTYEQSTTTGKSRLVSVQEFGSDNSSSLPPHIMSWHDSPLNLTESFVTGPSNSNWSTNYGNTIIGDFNGDGKSDIVLQGEHSKFTGLNLSTGDTFSETQIPLHTLFPSLAFYDYSGTSALRVTTFGDVDGDGRQDIISSHAIVNATTSIIADYVFSPDTVQQLGTRLVSLPKNTNSQYDATGRDLQTSDFDADGRSDILLQSKTAGQTSYVLLSNGFGESLTFQRVDLDSSLSGTDSLILADLNSDGRSDLIQCTKRDDLGYSTVKFHLSSYDATLPPIGAPIRFRIINSTMHLPLDCKPTFGDFNGDGKIDLISSAGGYKLYMGDGHTFAAPVLITEGALALSGVHGATEGILLAGDFNGDGRDDLFVYSNTSLAGAHITLSTGLNFSPPLQSGSFLWQATDAKWRADVNEISLADVNGDGQADVVLNEKRPWIFPPPARQLAVFVSATQPNDRLRNMTSPMGMQAAVEFTPAAKMPTAIIPLQPMCVTQHGFFFCNPMKPYGVQFASQPNAIRRFLISKLTISDGRGSEYTTTYAYHNARLVNGDFRKRRDLGFEWVQETKPGGSRKRTFYEQSNFDLAGAPIREQQFNGAGQLRTEIINTAIVTSPYLGTKVQSVIKKRMIAYEQGVVTVDSMVETQYDGYNFPTTITTALVGFEPMVAQTVYQHDVANNIFGKVSDRIVYEGSGGGLKSSHYRNIYNGAGATCGQPTQTTLVCEKQVWLDKSKNGQENRFISEFYTYSIYGTTLSQTDAMGRTTTYTYETDYQTFLALRTNAKGYRSQTVFDARFGTMLSQTDLENNISGTREYDVFGRHIRTKNSNGDATEELLYVNYGNPATQYNETRIADNSSEGYQWTRTYFDGILRTYMTQSEAIAATGVTLQTDMSFDPIGRKASNTNAYLNPGTTPRYTKYLYDADNRVTAIEYPEDRVDPTGKVRTTYAYGVTTLAGQVLTTTAITDANGNVKKTYKNARGQIVRIEEANTVVRYSYSEQGRLLQTVDADGNSTNIEYDSLNRKIRLVEPNMGTTVYRYDDVGNIVEQVDGKAQVILFTYDALNRITLKDLPGSETDVQYLYDSPASAYGIGRLSQINDAAGALEYNYDNRGNMTAWKRTVDGYTFTFQATYDIQNRTDQLTYPDGYKSRNYYSDTGHLRQVRMLSPSGFFGSSLVTYQGPETTGTTEFLRILGNGVSSKIAYDDQTLRPTYIKTALKNDTTFVNPVQDLSYSYDNVGNLIEIQDGVNTARTEKYSYDSLNRLTQARSGMYGTKNYAYTPGGNLTQNGALQLHYGNDSHCAGTIRPVHGVCADGQGNQYEYDLNGNMITRKGRSLVYDSEDRLKEIKENGLTKLSMVYNHSGGRIKKIRPDGAITYSIGGLYEVQKKPNGSEVHTKYFMGANGDRVAQVTKDSSQVTLAAVTITSAEIYVASGYGSFMSAMQGIGDGFSYLIVGLRDSLSTNRRTGHISIFLLVVVGGLGVIVIRSRGANIYAFWQRAVAMPALVCFLTVVFTNCSGSTPIDNGIPWETNTGSTAGIPTLDTPAATYNDATLGGMPITGTFFLVPNHLGSTTLVTDASGTSILLEMHYEPYGQLISPSSSGPDIIRNKYTGQEHDAETGLTYYGTRYYDSHLGRFISSDSLVYRPDLNNAHNRYMYGLGSPTQFNDPTGRFFDFGLFAIFVAFYASDEEFRDDVNDTVKEGWNDTINLAKDVAAVAGAVANPFSVAINAALTFGIASAAGVEFKNWEQFYSVFREVNWSVTVSAASAGAGALAGGAAGGIGVVNSLGGVAGSVLSGAASGIAGAAVQYALTPEQFNHANFLEQIGIGAAKGAVSGLIDGAFEKLGRSLLGLGDASIERGTEAEGLLSLYRTFGKAFSGAAEEATELALSGKSITFEATVNAGLFSFGTETSGFVAAFGGYSESVTELGRMVIGVESKYPSGPQRRLAYYFGF